MIKRATFSEDRLRRWELIRDWRDEAGPDRTFLLAMLNPSKAGEEADDPTVRKGVGFGKRWGFGRMIVWNLNPIVSTDPWQLPYWNGIDPQNVALLQRWEKEVDLIVAAWGSQPSAICRRIALPELIYSFCQTVSQDIYCIGMTKKGDPLHPSRARYTEAPVLWRSRTLGSDETTKRVEYSVSPGS